jgi:two-component system sensor histidine kinase HydH
MAGLPDSSSPDAYRELAQLVGHLVHEIKNHISTLNLHLQLLAEDLAGCAGANERRSLQRAQKLQQECQRLTELSNDFLRFAQLRELKRSPTNLRELIEELADFYGPSARQANVSLKLFLASDLPTVEWDRELIKQAMLNLILNAAQAMPQGGTLTIQAERAGERVLIHFIDTGAGIPPDVAGRIFEPFYTTRAGGSGLGLPTVRRIAEAHGGQISLQSEPGRGTKFTLDLPVAPSA